MHAKNVSTMLQLAERAMSEYEYQTQSDTERHTLTVTLTVQYNPPTSYEKRHSAETTLRLSATEFAEAEAES